MARCVQSRMIVTEKARLRALRERCTIPSPSGKSAAPSASEKSTVRVLRKKRGPSVSRKVHDPESVGKKRGSEQSDRYRKSTAPSRMIITEKARLRALRERRTIPSPSGKSTIRVLRKKVRSECFGKSAVRVSRGRCMIPSPSGKSAAPSRVIVTEKARLRVFR